MRAKESNRKQNLLSLFSSATTSPLLSFAVSLLQPLLCSLLLVSFFFLISCSKKSEQDDELRAPTVSAPPPIKAAVEKKDESPKYSYPFAQKRDPFLPLIGAQMAQGEGGKSPFAAAENPNKAFATLKLAGIIKHKKGKIAIIESTDGRSYTLKSGRIYDDEQNLMISGVTGIIKENSVLLISENKIVKPLYLVRE